MPGAEAAYIERVVATHESGHAVCALYCEHATPIERISIQADTAGALGFVRYQDPAHRYVVTRAELLDDICILMGGREAEILLLDDVSIGSVGDLERATAIARALVEEFGLGGDGVPVLAFLSRCAGSRRALRGVRSNRCRPSTAASCEHSGRRPTAGGRRSCGSERRCHRDARTMLLEKKVIEAKTLACFLGKK